MQSFYALLCLATAVVVLLPAAVNAQEDAYSVARREARRELELAKLELGNFWQFDYPRMRRHLDAQIALVEAEVRRYKDWRRYYRQFDRFSHVSERDRLAMPLIDSRMCLLEAELRLRDLAAERNSLLRYRTAQWRLLEMRVYDARLRVAEIEAAAETAAAEEELPSG